MKIGDTVHVKVTILRRARDERPEGKRGYVIFTSRGTTAYVEPEDIVTTLQKERKE